MKYITIPGFEKLSKQELFDMSAAHICSTRQKSYGSVVGCSYAGSGCAAAPFIRPEHRQRADKYGTWARQVDLLLAPDHETSFVLALQCCHDFATERGFFDDWKRNMCSLAERHGLSTAKLDELSK